MHPQLDRAPLRQVKPGSPGSRSAGVQGTARFANSGTSVQPDLALPKVPAPVIRDQRSIARIRKAPKRSAAVVEHVRIFDTTLRDGEQSPGFSLTSEQKLEFARQLERLNVDVIEAGFPAASPDDFAAIQQIAREIKGRIVTGLARCVPE